MPVRVGILDSKLQTLLQSQSRAIEQGHDEPHRPLEMREDPVDFFQAEDDRDAMREPRPGHLVDLVNLDAEYMTIEKQQGARRFGLRRARRFAPRGVGRLPAASWGSNPTAA